MESSSFHDIQVEAARKLQKWDENMESAEEVVYSSFLVGAAREVGLDVDGLVKLPMMNVGKKKDQSVQVNVSCSEGESFREAEMDVSGLVMLPSRNVEVKDQSIQVSVPCPDCELFERSGMVGDFSFSDDEKEEDSARLPLVCNCDLFTFFIYYIYHYFDLNLIVNILLCMICELTKQ